MLQPNRRKYRKEQKGRNTGLATVGAKVSFGEWGLKATARGRLTARHGASCRLNLTRHDAPHQARWAHLDPYFPGQARLQKATGSSYG